MSSVEEAQHVPFGIQQYIDYLISQDPHDIDRVVAIPMLHEAPAFETSEWVFEHLKYVCLWLTIDVF